MKFITEIIVEARIPTTQYGFNHVTVKSLVNEDDDVVELRNKLIALCEGTLVLGAPTPIEEFVAQVDIKSEEVVKEKKTKKVKVKFTAYDRNSELHKKLFQEILTTNVPDWKKDPSKAKAASMLLEKEDFLDQEGDVVENFKVKLLKAMA